MKKSTLKQNNEYVGDVQVIDAAYTSDLKNIIIIILFLSLAVFVIWKVQLSAE